MLLLLVDRRSVGQISFLDTRPNRSLEPIMASNTAPSSIITQVSTGASLTSNDVIGETIRTGRSESILDCKCHSTKDRKGNRGTVQCSTWSHLACYKLLTKETKSSSFTFVCETCTTNPPVPCLTLSQPIPKTRLRALSEPPADKRSSPSAAMHLLRLQ